MLKRQSLFFKFANIPGCVKKVKKCFRGMKGGRFIRKEVMKELNLR
jgi:hypothetical protein